MHADKDGNLAVVAVMFQEGAPSAALTKLWEKMPAKSGDKNPLPAGMSVTQLLPAQRDYYRYRRLTDDPAVLRRRALAGVEEGRDGLEGADRFVREDGGAPEQPAAQSDKCAHRFEIARLAEDVMFAMNSLKLGFAWRPCAVRGALPFVSGTRGIRELSIGLRA